MIAVITTEGFSDPALLECRRRDHERIDTMIGARVAAEDPEAQAGRPVRRRRRLLAPLNRWSSRRFCAGSRRDVWLNVADLYRAREQSSQAYVGRLAEFERLRPPRSRTCSARVHCCCGWRTPASGSGCLLAEQSAARTRSLALEGYGARHPDGVGQRLAGCPARSSDGGRRERPLTNGSRCRVRQRIRRGLGAGRGPVPTRRGQWPAEGQQPCRTVRVRGHRPGPESAAAAGRGR